MEQQEIRVELGPRSYSILVGSNNIGQLAARLRGLFTNSRHAVVIFDAEVTAWAQTIAGQLESAAWRISLIPVPSGESSKCLTQLDRIWQEMLRGKTDRGTLVVAIGGGVIGDLAGFAAASYARGLSLIQVPTTLLSQVDSSVGGKTAINLPTAKNMVGAFWQPSLVLIDTQTLATLPEREYISGLAEVVKYGVILIPELFEYLERHAGQLLQRDADALCHIIVESCRAKAMVVQQDERETSGLRAVLNYGHTFAHAIEATTGYGSLLHGEAVAIGMNMAARLAEQLGRVDDSFVQRQRRLLQSLKLPIELATANPQQLWQSMQSDKKVEHGTLRFILPSRLGQVELVSGITQPQVERAIR